MVDDRIRGVGETALSSTSDHASPRTEGGGPWGKHGFPHALNCGPTDGRIRTSEVGMSTAIERVFGLHIDGESEAGTGRRMPVGEPATGEPLADVRLPTPADRHRAVDSAPAALPRPRGETPAEEPDGRPPALAD